MPPPPAPASVPNPPTPPENPSKFVKVISVDSNNFEFKSTINGKVVTVTAQKVNNGTKVNGKPISVKADSVAFVSVPTEKIKALIVIDGTIAKDLDLNKINPQTIESMNVLKGEKANEKYGKNGANGVIEIITKKH
jgi:outer membrane receptor protein involved in Fe transport